METGSLQVFPNPCTGGNIRVRFPSVQSAMIRVFTIDGKLIYLTSVNGQALYNVNIPGAGNNHLLVMQIVTKEKTSSFTVMNN